MADRRLFIRIGIALASIACASPVIDPGRYRLMDSGVGWEVAGDDRVLADIEPRYPDLFEVILDPRATHDPNLLGVRSDLEATPVDRSNFDALNAIAIAYFVNNQRAEEYRNAGSGLLYLGLSQRSARLLAVPWRAYAETDDPALRGAILDFFEDAGLGSKAGTETTAGRLIRIVESLERKETDPGRRARIRAIAAAVSKRVMPAGSPTE